VNAGQRVDVYIVNDHVVKNEALAAFALGPAMAHNEVRNLGTRLEQGDPAATSARQDSGLPLMTTNLALSSSICFPFR
jgi:hypothetical protein